MPNLNQPLDYDTTRLFYDLFKEKFGEVWESDTYLVLRKNDVEEYSYHSDMDEPILTDEERDSILPALTLGAFCEFTKKVLGKTPVPGEKMLDGHYGTSFYPYKGIGLNKHYIKEPFEVYFMLLYKQINHFALDHWHDPEKLYDEVAGFLENSSKKT